MKIAVSIPDPVFAEAEALAKRMKTSRSEIYARALAAYVGDHAPDHVTKAMNQAIDAIEPETDDFARAAALRVFDRVDW